jgi:hypothetical protein
MMWGLTLMTLWRGPIRRRLFGTLRVASYVMLLLVVVTVLGIRRVKADVRAESFKFARDLLPIADMLSGATGLRLNGEHINLSVSDVSNTPVGQVLDRVEENCKQHPGPFAAKMQALADRLPPYVPGRDGLKDLLEMAALTRDESDGHGAILCFTSEDHVSNSADIDLGEGGDLGALGNLRYVVASAGTREGGDLDKTRIVSLWTQDHFRLENLQPPAIGDAPGSDSLVMPRPPRSTRLFTAEAVGAPYAVRVYETDESPDSVLAFYDKALADWTPMTLQGYEKKGRGFVKDAQPLVLNVAQDEAKTVVTLTEMGIANTKPAMAAED